MIIGVPQECVEGECRVAASPASVKKLIGLGYEVYVQTGAGSAANFPDAYYAEAGAELVADRDHLWSQSDLIIKVLAPEAEEISLMKEGAALVSFIWPARSESLVERLREKNITTLAMDCVPRISRAQKLDALSSMANIAGYRAVVEAANEFGSFFTGQITAAGKVPPAKVMVIGAGVAGLAAIGTAKGLGAIVRAFDTRLAVKDQVKSMGADFLELEFEESGEGEGGYAKTMSDEFIAAEMALFADQCKEVDIIVTTALIPGKPAPKLITAQMVESMGPGSVIVDLAAEQGGNCELTVPNEKVVRHGVTIIGYTDLPSRLPTQSSSLYANNIVNLLTDMTPEKDGQLVVDMEDVVVRGSLVTYQGDTTWPPPEIENPSPAPAPAAAPPVEPAAEPARKGTGIGTWVAMLLALALLYLIGQYAPSDFIQHFTVFVLACFIGWQVVWNVTPALHTPLMSVTNAISGIIIIGGMLQMAGSTESTFSSVTATLLAGLAVLIAMINVAGGFLVTHRMLGMFRKQD
ncbi:MAG: Re/Si-specific NAD(P)(+) transhydrogenase subunit alpha [Planctomycetota bacterium]|nr:Re/Si-specific NAD(P)(+) transhydrogenase subunit alpha [Planctomycetota bacterium]